VLDSTFLFVVGLADDPSSTNVVKAEAKPSSSSKMDREVFFVCLVIAAVGILSVCLFKLWQKKKREEQHARLLRLFEEDDELELELGLRD
ncbi:hypothetical protein B296_00043669, partial [Ensete ventricosum]